MNEKKLRFEQNKSDMIMKVENKEGNIKIELTYDFVEPIIKFQYDKVVSHLDFEIRVTTFDVTDTPISTVVSIMLEMFEEVAFFNLDLVSCQFIVKKLNEWFFGSD
ncbi:MAG: hypothetical protein JRE40_00265 [Deltaproteobacteria bacterium]|nr:hypothetical protein [Deltaproteobacteria bacterium]